jgi:hypothetical protein
MITDVQYWAIEIRRAGNIPRGRRELNSVWIHMCAWAVRGPREERGNAEMQRAQRGHRCPRRVAGSNLQPEDDRQYG